MRPGIAQWLNANVMIVHTIAFMLPGTEVQFPLDSVDGERIFQTGVINSCEMISARVHQTEIHFEIPLDPEHFVICWGVAVSDDGPLGPPPDCQVGAHGLPVPQGEVQAAKVRERAIKLADKLARVMRTDASGHEIRVILQQISVTLGQMSEDQKPAA